jgi:hypothetical protein
LVPLNVVETYMIRQAIEPFGAGTRAAQMSWPGFPLGCADGGL